MWCRIWCPCLVMLAQCGWVKWSASVIVVDNPLSWWPCCQTLIRAIWEEGTMPSTDIALVCGLKVRVGCQDMLCAVIKLQGGRVPPSRVSVSPSRFSVSPSRFRRPPIEIWALDDETITSQLAWINPTNLAKDSPKLRWTPFFWSSLDFREKTLQFSAKTFFLVFWFRGKNTSIAGTELHKFHWSLVKAAKASPHAKFYNLCTGYVWIQMLMKH